jgi:hypothetical protein
MNGYQNTRQMAQAVYVDFGVAPDFILYITKK